MFSFKNLLFISFFLTSFAQAQWWNFSEGGKPDARKMLIMNNGIQTEVGSAVKNMYNFKFAEAEKEYHWFKQKYAGHPMPYMLLGLNEWWKIVPNTDNPMYDERCLAMMDSTIYWAEKMYDDTDNKVEAAFFLSAAYGFKGRLYAERKKWTKAAFAGKNALKYLEKSRGYEDLSPELQFGDGLYNYYVEWIPKNYPSLKPILWLFPNGNKEKGIRDLEKVCNNAFYTRTEARYFLMQIYSLENQHEKCYQLSKYMHETYPDNPYFHRYLASKAFATGHTAEAVKEAEEILNKLEGGYVGYEGVTGRYASYILAYTNHFVNKDLEKAKLYYNKTIEFALRTGAKQSGYHVTSVLNLGKIAQAEGDIDTALSYYQQAEDLTDKKMTQRSEAKRLIDEVKKLKKEAKKKK